MSLGKRIRWTADELAALEKGIASGKQVDEELRKAVNVVGKNDRTLQALTNKARERPPGGWRQIKDEEEEHDEPEKQDEPPVKRAKTEQPLPPALPAIDDSSLSSITTVATAATAAPPPPSPSSPKKQRQLAVKTKPDVRVTVGFTLPDGLAVNISAQVPDAAKDQAVTRIRAAMNDLKVYHGHRTEIKELSKALNTRVEALRKSEEAVHARAMDLCQQEIAVKKQAAAVKQREDTSSKRHKEEVRKLKQDLKTSQEECSALKASVGLFSLQNEGEAALKNSMDVASIRWAVTQPNGSNPPAAAAAPSSS